jgi:uncharacterized protein YcsI (UPF0317 family)
MVDAIEVARAARLKIRAGNAGEGTAGRSPGVVQGNVAILPKDWAADFMRFCNFNPRPCPAIGVSEPGDPTLPMLGDDIDIRTDCQRYRVFKDGEQVDEVSDIHDYWCDDLVTFILGCSYSFEDPLIQAGVPLRHIEQGREVAAYRSNIETTPAGPFRGQMVVSMRPLKPAQAIRAIQITSRFPGVHGAPVHFGDPERIGITKLDQPDWGQWNGIEDGEVPVFWACGVTPQVIIEQARPPLCITHKPGCMLITDRLNAELAAL